MSIPNKNNKKIVLGKKTAEGYEYAAKIDFSKDISTQISKVIAEKEANELLKKKIKELKELIERFPRKEKNLQYYYEVGKKLLFLEDKLFRKIALNSVLRRIAEELPDIIPDIKNTEMKIRNLYFMYWIGHIRKKDLFKASWDQWFEITKFREIYKNKKLLNLILKECKSRLRGHESLNKKIKDLIKKHKKS
jgi:sulfur transfer protein SufE